MYIVQVHIHIKPEFIDGFIDATITNAQNSIREAGVARFDVLQDLNDPTHFELLEVYHTAEDPARHKDTEHYNTWRVIAEPMLKEPRSRTQYKNIFPPDLSW